MELDLIVRFFSEYGYLGMGVMAFLSGSVLPLTSEVLLMLLLGMGLNSMGLVVVSTIGNTIGGITCFYTGRIVKKEKVGRLFRVPEKRMRQADRIIQKYGFWASFLSFVPLVGTAILLTLGMLRVNPVKVTLVMMLGKFLRYLLVAASYTGFTGLFNF
ncbi:MAG: DedA family protein [Bacteroidaceae bacterium]|nr:DedA family protein [Bacteroidaceae bacterium]